MPNKCSDRLAVLTRECGCTMGPACTRKKGRQYRYYLCVHASKEVAQDCPVRAIPAGDVEQVVMEQLRSLFRSPELVARTYAAARQQQIDEVARLTARKVGLRTRSRRDASGRWRLLPRPVNELAQQHGVDPSLIGRTLRLTTLAPDITQAILAGQDPNGLSFRQLTRSFPELWSKQREHYGFAERLAHDFC